MVPANKLRQTDWLRAAFQTGKRNLFTQYAYCSTKQNAELCGIVFIFCLEEEITTLPNFRIMALDDELPNCQTAKVTNKPLQKYDSIFVLPFYHIGNVTVWLDKIKWLILENHDVITCQWQHFEFIKSEIIQREKNMIIRWKEKKNTNDDGKT